MRLLHPTTLEIVTNEKFPRTIISHVWSEIFKFYTSKQTHPKMFIKDDRDMGIYLGFVWVSAKKRGGLSLDLRKVNKLPTDLVNGFNHAIQYNHDNLLKIVSNLEGYINEPHGKYFNDYYLMSDACSLYFKGYNIFPYIFGDHWRKYVPVESRKEILRQLNKIL